jgi:hypothetical protein
MPLTTTDQIRLNAAAGHLQIGDAMDAWHELEMIAPQARAQTEVLVVCLAVCRALKNWELSEDSARLLIAREPNCWKVTTARVISEDSDELTIKRHNRFSFGS